MSSPLANWTGGARSSLFLACMLALSCSGEAEEGAADGGEAQFTLRGRWEDPSRLRYRIRTEDAAVAPGIFRESLVAAMDCWAETGVVGFVEAEPDADSVDITFSWQRGKHGDCDAFGSGPGIAHAGPVGGDSFIHFDAARQWSRDASQGRSLDLAALHELGHVLGLGHSDAKGSLMHPDPKPEVNFLGSAELAGIHSLYGGGEDSPDDLMIIAGDSASSMRRVAAVDRSEFTLFDSDGDGDDEVIVWRTDHAGHGAVMIYHFAPGPRLERTLGPFYGSVGAEVPNLFVKTQAGERLLFCVYPGLSIRVLSLDEHGLPAARPEGQPFVVDRILSDEDGDGRLDREFEAGEYLRREGDLDGNGQAELLRRSGQR